MAGIAVAVSSCGDNDWNDKLDGFESDQTLEKATDGTYTLTDADYASISKLMEAIATDDAEKAAAKAIKTNLYFDKNSAFPASVCIPALFAEVSSPYYFSVKGSALDVTYREASEVPAELTALAGAETYTVSADNYKAVWGSEENFINGFAPAKPASGNLPAILAEQFATATNGQYVVVSYEEASTNPVFGGIDDAPVVYLDETFASSIGEFTLDNVKLPEGSSYIWKWNSYNDLGYMKASAFVNKACRESEGWLISPELALGAKANAVFTYEQAWKNFKSVENAKQEATAWVRVKGGNWEQVVGDAFPGNTSYDYIPSGNIDLSAYNGKTIQIGFCYKSSTESAGTWQVKNVKVEDGAAARSRALAAEVPTTAKNAVYFYNGSKWSVATGVSVLNPADYTAMGSSNNKLVDAEIYIPMYLKNKLPYAQSGDQQFVVYNGTACDLFVFNGTEWTLNNNGLETVTARFSKDSEGWKFQKYLGKAIYTAFNENEIELDRSYLITYGDICATPASKSDNHAYLLATSFQLNGDQVIMSSDANAFAFNTKATVDDVEYKAPEGKFMIVDSNNRYLYRSGTYASFNFAAAPALADKKISDAYLWTATRNEDGSWAITCENQPDNVRSIFFSTKYSNFAVYATADANSVYPSLFILE